MKSDELYRRLRANLGGWFKAAGFKRAPKAPLGWYDEAMFVWFQCDKWGWDNYAGSSFFVNFQRGGEPVPWNAHTDRLQQFLSADELETARRLQNAVIRRLQPPPANYIETMRAAFAKQSQDPDALIEGLLMPFRTIDAPYRNNQDFSLRYFSAQDVDAWASFLLSVLPGILRPS